MNKFIFFIIAILFYSSVSAKNECISNNDSTGSSGVGSLGTSYDYIINNEYSYHDFNLSINGTSDQAQLGEKIRLNLDVYNISTASKLNYFWRDSCDGKILSENSSCTRVELTIRQDIEKNCRIQAEVQDGLGHSEIVDFQYNIIESNMGHDYKLEIYPKYIEAEFYEKSTFNLALKHNKPAYDKEVILKKRCFYNDELEWSNSLTYAPSYDVEHEWDYTVYNGYGLRKCDLSISLDGDVNLSNNSSTVYINIVDPNPITDSNKDIFIKTASVSKSTNINQGEMIDIDATQIFSGTTSNNFVTSLGYFLSEDKYYSSDDILLATDKSGLNNEEPSDDESVRWKVPQNQVAGIYYILLVADYLEEHSEINEGNNVYSVKITIKDKDAPNLFFSKVSLEGQDSKLELGESTALTVQLGNSGGKSSGDGILNFYRSTDKNISTSDTNITSVSFSSINAGMLGDDIHQTLVSPATVGEYWYGACIIPVSGEIDTDNNCSDGIKVTVIESQPDLVVNFLDIPDSIDQNSSINATVNIQNIGGKSSVTTNIAIYYSDNKHIDTNDHKVAKLSVPVIHANNKKTINISVTFPESGNKWIYACVGGKSLVESDRSIESNCSVVKKVAIQENLATSIHSVLPESVILNQLTTFIINGTDLPDTLAFWVDMCKDLTKLSSSKTQVKFRCTPSYSVGNKNGVIKDKPKGKELKRFSVRVTEASNNFYIDAFYNDFPSYFGSKNGSNYTCDIDYICQKFLGGRSNVDKIIRVRKSDNSLYWKIGRGVWYDYGIKY